MSGMTRSDRAVCGDLTRSSLLAPRRLLAKLVHKHCLVNETMDIRTYCAGPLSA